MKPIITSLLILATSLVAQARIIQHWPDQELLEKSDLVVIATPTTTADTKERTDLPGFLAQHVIGVETGFAVSAVVKGDKAMKNFVLHHYRADGDPSFRGPNFVAFKPEEKRKFLLFLKREADDRYAPTVGQVDPGFQGIAVLGNPMSTTPNSPPPTDVAKPTPLNAVESSPQQDGETKSKDSGLPSAGGGALPVNLDIAEAVFRHQFSHNASGAKTNAAAYFLSFNGADPDAEFLKRFKDLTPPVKKSSEHGIERNKVVDPASGRAALVFIVSSIKSSKPDEASAEGGYNETGMSGSTNTYTLNLKDGKWVVVKDQMNSIK